MTRTRRSDEWVEQRHGDTLRFVTCSHGGKQFVTMLLAVRLWLCVLSAEIDD